MIVDFLRTLWGKIIATLVAITLLLEIYNQAIVAITNTYQMQVVHAESQLKQWEAYAKLGAWMPAVKQPPGSTPTAGQTIPQPPPPHDAPPEPNTGNPELDSKLKDLFGSLSKPLPPAQKPSQ